MLRYEGMDFHPLFFLNGVKWGNLLTADNLMRQFKDNYYASTLDLQNSLALEFYFCAQLLTSIGLTLS